VRSRLLVAAWALIVTTALVFTVLRFLNLFGHDTLDFVALTSLTVTTATLGTLILRRHPRHRIGVLFLVLGAVMAVSLGMREVATELDPTSPIAGWTGLVEELLRVWGLGLAFVLLLVFPTGRLLSRRWIWLVVLLGVVMTLGWASGQLLVPGVIDGLPVARAVRNPFATAATGRIAKALEPAGILAPVAIVGVLASIVVRYRRAAHVERDQIKYFALSVVGVIVLIGGVTAAFPDQTENGILGSIVWQTPGIFPPLAAGHAILRLGLFDIERVISRTLSYAAITAILAGVFVVVALGPTAIVGSGERPDWVTAMATLVVAALFRPVRRRVQDAVDHRFNRKRYNAEHIVDTFTTRLRSQIDIDALGAELIDVVQRTMQPSTATMWVKGS
jgi:hypothetical protein